MSTTKALEIAELEGWEDEFPQFTDNKIYRRGKERATESQLELLYSSFNGLMEIVFRVNRHINYYEFVIDREYINLYIRDEVYCFELNDNNEIEALQDAILFYHRNKE